MARKLTLFAFFLLVSSPSSAAPIAAVTRLTFDPPQVVGGNGSAGQATGTVTVERYECPACPLSVQITMSPGPATASSPVGIGPNQNTGTFTINTNIVAQDATVIVTAKLFPDTPDESRVSEPFTVLATTLSLSAGPGQLISGTSDTATGTITLAPARVAPPNSVNLSANPPMVSMPSPVAVPLGQTTATFPISPGWVEQFTTVTITGDFFGIQATAAVDILPFSCQQDPSAPECLPPGEQQPAVTIGPLTAVGKNLSADVQVTVTPEGTPINLRLATNSETGAAKFTSNNSTSLWITTSGNINIAGVTESSTANDIRLSAIWNNTTLATRDFTVIAVSFSLRPSTGQRVSPDNAARDLYIGRFGTDALGVFNSILDEWVTGVEVVGRITPSDFAQPVMLRRIVTARAYFDKILIESESKDGQEELSDLRDDDPQSDGSGGKVYDLDGPRVGPKSVDPVGTIIRLRANFTQWADVDGVRVSSDLHWFSRISAKKRRQGNVLDTSVAGDNVAGVGATNLTWNLQ